MSGTKKPSVNDHTTAREHASAVAEYLACLLDAGIPLPRRAGQPNRSAIAAACGMHRQVLYQNPECARLLRGFDVTDRERHLTKLQQAEAVRDSEQKVDQERFDLRAEVLRLNAKVASLEKDLARYARIEAHMVVTGRLP